MSSIKKKVVLHLTATSLWSGGGGEVTLDIHRACLQFGYDSYVIVRGKSCIYPDGSIKSIPSKRKYYWNKLKRFLFRKIVRHAQIDDKYSMYNLCERFTCYSAEDLLNALPQKPDVIFVHWVSDFANARVIHELSIKTGAWIVFVLVDHALFSGGCHYQFDCQGYKNGCHNCPATSSFIIRKAIENNYRFKKKYLSSEFIIAARGVDKQRLKESEIYKDFRQELIVFPVDESFYCPASSKEALREKWGIGEGRKVVLVGATHLKEKRKGMSLFVKAIQLVHNDVLLIIAGYVESPISFSGDVLYPGFLNKEQLKEAYQLSDVFVCPSLADSGPLMVKQACLCGTPVVAFPVGVSVELVENDETGYLANYNDVEDLAKGIDLITSLSAEEWQEMSCRCRERAVGLFSFQAGHTIDDLLQSL